MFSLYRVRISAPAYPALDRAVLPLDGAGVGALLTRLGFGVPEVLEVRAMADIQGISAARSSVASVVLESVRVAL